MATKKTMNKYIWQLRFTPLKIIFALLILCIHWSTGIIVPLTAPLPSGQSPHCLAIFTGSSKSQARSWVCFLLTFAVFDCVKPLFVALWNPSIVPAQTSIMGTSNLYPLHTGFLIKSPPESGVMGNLKRVSTLLFINCNFMIYYDCRLHCRWLYHTCLFK